MIALPGRWLAGLGAVLALVGALWLWHRHALAVAVAEARAGLVAQVELSAALAEAEVLREAIKARDRAAAGFREAAEQAEAEAGAIMAELERVQDERLAIDGCVLDPDLAGRLRAD